MSKRVSKRIIKQRLLNVFGYGFILLLFVGLVVAVGANRVNEITTNSTDENLIINASGTQVVFEPIINVSQDLIFYGEIRPDGVVCGDNEILKRIGAANWDCAADVDTTYTAGLPYISLAGSMFSVNENIVNSTVNNILSPHLINLSAVQANATDLWANASGQEDRMLNIETNYLSESGGVISGNLLINGNLDVIGTYVNLTVLNAYANGSFMPERNNLFYLGSVDYLWKGRYISDLNASYLTYGSIPTAMTPGDIICAGIASCTGVDKINGADVTITATEVGTVSSVATTANSGLVGGTITSTGTLGIDSSIIANWTGATAAYYPIAAGNSLSSNSTALYLGTNTLATNMSAAQANITAANTNIGTLAGNSTVSMRKTADSNLVMSTWNVSFTTGGINASSIQNAPWVSSATTPEPLWITSNAYTTSNATANGGNVNVTGNLNVFGTINSGICSGASCLVINQTAEKMAFIDGRRINIPNVTSEQLKVGGSVLSSSMTFGTAYDAASDRNISKILLSNPIGAAVSSNRLAIDSIDQYGTILEIWDRGNSSTFFRFAAPAGTGDGQFMSSNPLRFRTSGNNDYYFKFDVIANIPQQYCSHNVTCTIGKAGTLMNTVYTKSTVTSDLFMDEGHGYVGRWVGKDDGVYLQMLPDSLISSCPEFNQSDCRSAKAEEAWNSTEKMLLTYDGDVVTSDGVSLRGMKSENDALKRLLINKGIVTAEEIENAK